MESSTDGLLALYRSARLLPAAAFHEAVSRFIDFAAAGAGEAAGDAEVIAHVFEALRINARVSDRGGGGQEGDLQSLVFALSAFDGRIRFEAAGFSELMALEWPEAPPGRLPDAIVELQSDQEAGQYSGRRVRVRLLSAGGALLVGVRRLTALDGLPPRRRAIASLYAEGWVPAAIAQRLGVSPSTVGNQLAEAYRELGIRSRRELAALACTAFSDNEAAADADPARRQSSIGAHGPRSARLNPRSRRRR